MDAEFLKILANYGAPAVLLFIFLIYFSNAIKHLANSIQEVANRFDAILLRHENISVGIAGAVNQMTQENTRLTATLNNLIQFASQVNMKIDQHYSDLSDFIQEISGAIATITSEVSHSSENIGRINEAVIRIQAKANNSGGTKGG